MTVAAKVIGAVRLGLVDNKEVIRELNTDQEEIDATISRDSFTFARITSAYLHAICEFEVCSREIQTAFHESGM